MKIKPYILVLILGTVCLFLISCTNNRMKKVDLADGTHLRMNAADNFSIEFVQETDELVLYPWSKQIRIPYTIIDDDTAKSYIDELPFSERYNEKRYSALVEQRDQLYFYYCAPFVTEDDCELFLYMIESKVGIVPVKLYLPMSYRG